jgi:microcystin-dependent protein
MATTTPKYGWTQPAVGGDPSTWGTLLNADLNAIDAQVYANQQGLSPIGTIVMFGGPTAPANWLPCDGRSLSTATYAALFAALGYAHGGSGANFNLPNFNGTFPTGAGATNALGAKGGHATQTLAVANMPVHAHPITDQQHNHGVTQTPHGHTSTPHNHAITDQQHSHSYNQVVSGGGPWGAGSLAATGAGTTGSSFTGITGTQNATVTIQTANANVSLSPSTTGITATGNAGSSSPTPVATVPPWVAVLFIIRYQ